MASNKPVTQRPGYLCPDCGKSFISESKLRDHMRVAHHEMGVELRPGKHTDTAIKGGNPNISPSADHD